MKVQHYQMDMRGVGDMQVGSAITQDSMLVGFVWRWDSNRKIADILTFEPVDLELKPHQKHMAAEVEGVNEKFDEVLRNNPGALAWWQKAASQLATDHKLDGLFKD